MITIPGSYFDGRTSGCQPAILSVDTLGIATLSSRENQQFPLRSLRIEDRVANTPRSIYFPDGAKFETTHNDLVDAALDQLGDRRPGRLLHVLETRSRYILLAVITVVAASWGLVRYGIPAGAKTAAFVLPAKTNTAIGRGTLALLDETVLAPTTLSSKARNRLARRFNAIRDATYSDIPLSLVFRAGGKIGANALALPSGTIIVTDELVKLARDDDEIAAVLAHEIGHVVYRHGLRNAIQDSVFGLLTILVTGDVSSTSALIAAVPALLVRAQYSQAFEREADLYAYQYLQAQAIDPSHFVRLLRRLEQGKESAIPAYLSTHPPSEERITLFSQTSRSPNP